MAAAAQAGTVTTTYTGGVGITTTVDTTNTTYDILTLTIASISNSTSSTDKVTQITGQWTVTGSTGFYITGPDDGVANTLTGAGKLGTWINFNVDTSTMLDGSTPAFVTSTATANVYSAFGDSWLTSATSKYLAVGKTLAVLYVTKNWTEIDFTNYNTDNPSKIYTVGLASSNPETITITQIVPEPSTLALLGCGLMGLLAYAWRKRK